MQRTDNHFWLSGFISFGLFLTFVTFFIYASLHVKRAINYSLNKNALSVSIYTEPIAKEKVVKKEKKKRKDSPVKKSNDKESSPIKTTAPKSISSLFDTIKTKKPTRSKKDIKKIKISKEFRKSLQKRTKTNFKEKREKSAKKIVDDLKESSTKLVIKQVDVNPASKGQYNEYYAKIQALIYKHWHPSSETAGSTAKIRLSLFASGQVENVKVLSYGENELFNVELEEFIERIKDLLFPIGAKSSVIEIYIGAKE